VVDSNDRERAAEGREELAKMVCSIPLAVLALFTSGYCIHNICVIHVTHCALFCMPCVYEMCVCVCVCMCTVAGR
jgi:hypothetical protein